MGDGRNFQRRPFPLLVARHILAKEKVAGSPALAHQPRPMRRAGESRLRALVIHRENPSEGRIFSFPDRLSGPVTLALCSCGRRSLRSDVRPAAQSPARLEEDDFPAQCGHENGRNLPTARLRGSAAPRAGGSASHGARSIACAHRAVFGGTRMTMDTPSQVTNATRTSDAHVAADTRQYVA